MDLTEPSAAICPSLDGPVLAVLARMWAPLSARAIARQAGRGSVAGVNRTLQRLVEHGIVLASDAPPAILYTLNRDHLAAPIVELLTTMRAELCRRMSEAIVPWQRPPVFASLFGSAARGDGTTESDIDVFLIRPSGIELDDDLWSEQLGVLRSGIRDWTGNHASMIEVSADALDDRGAPRLGPFVRRIRKDWVPLYGVVPRELESLADESDEEGSGKLRSRGGKGA